MFTEPSARRGQVEVNASSMADIAFLLLIFFLVTTTIATDQGLAMRLPPLMRDTPMELAKRNVLTILVNSQNELLVEGQPLPLAELRAKVKAFVANPAHDKSLAESPKQAVVSVKTDRGTSYPTYVAVLDQVKRAYHELRADYLGISLANYLATFGQGPEHLAPAQQKRYAEAQARFPIQISETEPSAAGGL
jgi:biopolymer transport protein ExbD